ncbi:MAG TPA: hypothetical protein PLS71_07125 [Leptospiraceae bacterium]|nr:hypothetical protein [Leptospiraceae bacterium]HNK94597.1 hypothetical protein [Leptospiraceae bacterium]
MKIIKYIQYFVVSILISILTCISPPKKEDSKKEEPNYLLAFVTDPNGIAIYKDPSALTSKIGTIPYKQKYLEAEEYSIIPNYKNGATYAEAWHKVFKIQYANLEGSIIKNIDSSLNFYLEKQNPMFRFGVVESIDDKVYDFPFSDSKEIGKIQQFQLLENSIRCVKCQEERWTQINKNGEIGYTTAKVYYYEKRIDAENAILKKIIHLNGYLKVTAKSMPLLKADTFERIQNKKPKDLLEMRSEFFKVNYSTTKDKVKYYAVAGKNKEVLLTPESVGKYIEDNQFANYILSNGVYKKNECFLKTLAEKYSFSDFNFFNIEKVFLVSKKGSEYYFIFPRDEILKQKNGDRIPKGAFIAKQNGRCNYITEIEDFYDYSIKKDDKIEPFQISFSIPGRGGGAESIYGFKDGEFKLLASYLK